MMATLQFPTLNNPAHALLVAEASTGTVLHPDGRRWQQGDAAPWKVFPTFETALEWAEEHVRVHPVNECNICGADGKQVRRVWNPNAFAKPPRK